MKPNLHSLTFVFMFGGLFLINAVSALPVVRLQDATPTPTATLSLSVNRSAGDTNGIVFLGILIFAVIVAAIVVRLRELRAN